MKQYHPIIRLLMYKDILTMRNAAFLMRRPHRSFRRTYRRDYIRSLQLPGYWAFTVMVWKTLWRHKGLFASLGILYMLATIMLGGITNQQTYQQIADALHTIAGKSFSGALGTFGQAGLLLVSAFVTPPQFTSDQQLYLIIAGTLVWLTTVWLLREILAGRKPKLRDGIYSAGSPIVATIIVAFVGVLQLLPLGVVALVYAALTSVGLLTNGLPMFMFTMFELAVGILVLYWMTPTFLALVIVTLPGMYPFRALRAAGDIAIGRRLRILYRILWMFLIVVLAWAVVMIPLIIATTAASGPAPALKGIPLVPLGAAIMSAASFVWMSAYVYLLYRRIIDDDASPA